MFQHIIGVHLWLYLWL